MIRQKVHELISIGSEAAAKAAQYTGVVTTGRPSHSAYGDYASNIALQVSPSNPGPVAEKIASRISTDALIARAEARGGFVNVFLRPEVWHGELKKILLEKERYATLKVGKGQKVNIEFISANPTGELHVGNGRGAFFGDVLANVLEKTGYEAEREYLVNDAKSSVQIQELGRTALGKGEAYRTPYLEKVLEELKPELKKIVISPTSDVSLSTSDVFPAAEAGYVVAQRVLKDIKAFVTRDLKVRIGRWFSENDLFEKDKIEAAKTRVPTYKKDGAMWARTSDFGDDEDRVLVRSDGTPGYFLSDIAYHIDKAERADLLVDVWGADHQGHVKRMYAAAKHLRFADKLRVLITQIVHVKKRGEGKKMSKRAGETISLGWLIGEVGLDAARWFYLSKALNTHMDFDVSLAKEQSAKNPVYYVQYSFARSCQIFAKAQNDAEQTRIDAEEVDLSQLTGGEELQLIKKLAEWPEVLHDVVTGYERSESYDLHKLTTYAHSLAEAFHTFYETSLVIDSSAGPGQESVNKPRLALVEAYQIILKDVLGVLGVSAPEKM